LSCLFSSEAVTDKKVFTADKIDDHIWLGDIDSSENHEALDDLNITHILTVLDFDPERLQGDCRIRKHVRAYDLHTADLIGEFESCYQFIDQAVRKNQNVLIHCHAGIRKKKKISFFLKSILFAGMSRSATIACAYLMKKNNLSYETAHEQLKTTRPCVYPNPGFAKQLRLYHSMKYSFNPDHSRNKKSVTSDHVPIENNFDDVIPVANNDTFSIEYKCKLCRQILFTDADLLSHIAGKGRFDFHSRSSAYKARQNAESNDENYCRQELFTTQPDWLAEIYGKETNNGEIECPNSKCQAKLGRYSLVGEKCTCAKWVNPAFHFHRSKIDECSIKKNEDIEKLLLQRTVPV
jgi:dual specificity phosphatase 12